LEGTSGAVHYATTLNPASREPSLEAERAAGNSPCCACVLLFKRSWPWVSSTALKLLAPLHHELGAVSAALGGL